MKFIFPVLLLSLLLFSCSDDIKNVSVENLLTSLENRDLDSFQKMAPKYADISNEDFRVICDRLNIFFDDITTEITQGQENQFFVRLETQGIENYVLSFKMKKNDQGEYILSEDFSLSQNINFIPLEE
ncbi:MAG: hypothetical protein PF447_07230 [Spirochaetaceae bacterium]|jgi:hypothetical protein|nr:hypothetical protein [Spirochaetaceae bacterium]